MIMNNENKKVSRNRKRRIERNIKIDDNMKLLFKKIKSEKKCKNKILKKIKQVETLLVLIIYSNKTW